MSEMETMTAREVVFAHFGYPEPEPKENGWTDGVGIWPNTPGSLEENLSKLPGLVNVHPYKERRLRMTIDYDPDYPHILFRLIWLNPIQ